VYLVYDFIINKLTEFVTSSRVLMHMRFEIRYSAVYANIHRPRCVIYEHRPSQGLVYTNLLNSGVTNDCVQPYSGQVSLNAQQAVTGNEI
jgi:hypothetical protein